MDEEIIRFDDIETEKQKFCHFKSPNFSKDVDIGNVLVSNIYENTGGLFQKMSKELKSISNWFKTNKLSTNIDKTKWIIFYSTSIKRFMPSNFPDLFINGITIEKETVTKFLSVYIDEIVSCKNHINKLSNKTGFLKS